MALKKCPYCAEEIQDEAVVCKHCKRDIPQPLKPMPWPAFIVGTLVLSGVLLYQLGKAYLWLDPTPPPPAPVSTWTDTYDDWVSAKGRLKPGVRLFFPGGSAYAGEVVSVDGQMVTIRNEQGKTHQKTVDQAEAFVVRR